jgi:hypothetical protein
MRDEQVEAAVLAPLPQFTGTSVPQAAVKATRDNETVAMNLFMSLCIHEGCVGFC